MKTLRFAVLGAGHGGQGMAGYLAYLGYSVNLFNRSPEKIKNIRKKGSISLEGIIKGEGKLNIVTDDIKTAIENVQVIMVVVPASGHQWIAEKLAPYLQPNQYIVLNPGRTGGALEFKNIISQKNSLDISIVEAQTFLFASRVIEDGHVKIFGKKKEVKLAALPSIKTKAFIELVKEAIPEFRPAKNVLETSFNNVGALLHPIPTILNSGRIEGTKGDFQYYIEGITPSVARVIEAMDFERIKITKTLGVLPLSVKEWLATSYGSTGKTLYEAFQNTKSYYNIKAPSSLDTRYLFEDVPYSLVPMSDMGRHLGIPTPMIDSFINLASAIHNVDYYKIGRKIFNMGLDNSSLEEIQNFVKFGSKSGLEGVVA